MSDRTALRICSRCMTPETHETVTFDEEGVCNVCRQHEHKKTAIDWNARKADLDTLVAEYKGKNAYDCIVPFSGGKDSTFTLHYLVQQYGLKPLVVQFDHGFMRPGLRDNNERTFKKLGVDVLSFRPNWHVVRKVMLESLIRKGDFCWHCHTGIFAYPMQIAVKFEVPLLFWGEPSAEYTSYYGYDETEEVDERRFNRFVNLGITSDDMTGMIDLLGIDARDLNPFRYPPLKDLRKLRVRSVCLGSYIPWDVKSQTELIEKDLGWKGARVEGVPEDYTYEKIECFMQGIRDYLKFLKRGYSRTSHLTSIDIRNGRMDRKRALELVSEHDGKRPASLDVFLQYVGIDEKQFHDIAKGHAVAPWVCDHTTLAKGEPLPDFDHIDRTFDILTR
jgi:N-acetyl sugar amidotransferase